MKKTLSISLQYGISFVCLVHAFWGAPLADLWRVLRGYPVLPMLATIGVSFAAYAIMGVRLVRAGTPSLSFRSTFGATLVGLAVNNVLPAKAGEVVKAAWIGKRNGLSLDKGLGIVFMERFFDVNVLALLSLWFLWRLGRGRTAAFFVLCLAVGWGALFLLRGRPGWTVALARLPLPFGVAGFAARFLDAVAGQLTLGRLLWMSAASLAVWGVYALQMGFALNGAAGLGLSWGGVLGVFALSSLGMLLPSSPGALGVYEAVAIAALKAHGVAHDQALAAALFAHMAQFVPVTLAGGLTMLLARSERRPS